MHEMSLATALVELVEARALAEGASRVTRIGIEAGVLGHVEASALAFCLDSAAAGTLLEGASFEIRTPPGSAWCFVCRREVVIAKRGEACPHCRGIELRIASGDELRVTEMEIV